MKLRLAPALTKPRPVVAPKDREDRLVISRARLPGAAF
jgi:hypothetical protein